MKLTPEQKAFYEYGKAREALRLFKTDFAYREETLREFYENYVCEAWQKRAACRAWKPLIRRDCHNCKYQGVTPVPDVCLPCINEGIPFNWEPGTAAHAVGTNPGRNLHNSLMSVPAQVGGTVADGKEGK